MLAVDNNEVLRLLSPITRPAFLLGDVTCRRPNAAKTSVLLLRSPQDKLHVLQSRRHTYAHTLGSDAFRDKPPPLPSFLALLAAAAVAALSTPFLFPFLLLPCFACPAPSSPS